MTVVSNAGPLSLAQIGQIELLPNLFGQIVIDSTLARAKPWCCRSSKALGC